MIKQLLIVNKKDTQAEKERDEQKKECEVNQNRKQIVSCTKERQAKKEERN